MPAHKRLGAQFPYSKIPYRTALLTLGARAQQRSTRGLFAPSQGVARLLCALAISTLVPQLVGQANVPPPPSLEREADPGDGATALSKASPPLNQGLVLRIGTGDLLEINVSTGFGPPEAAWRGRVSSTGDVALPLLGACHVGGLTADEAEAAIQKRYKDGEILKDPHVSVLVTEYASQGISVLGEVAKPGVYPIMARRRLLDLISQAGGLTPLAGRTIAITHRSNPEQPQTLMLSRDPSKTVTENIDVFSGDTIVVGRAGVVYVVGAVVKPGGFTMDANTGLTVLQAFALAEGSKFEARLDKSTLIRKTESGREEIPIPLNKILSAQAHDLKLQADDIVFVPGSKAKSAARKGLETAVQTVSGVVIYHAY